MCMCKNGKLLPVALRAQTVLKLNSNKLHTFTAATKAGEWREGGITPNSYHESTYRKAPPAKNAALF